MKPVVALVGRPNVGKSTLFNRLTRTRDAIVADMPGLTRDRQYGDARVGEHEFIVIDTGGISGDEEGIDTYMRDQSMQAVEEANMQAVRDGVGGTPHFIINGQDLDQMAGENGQVYAANGEPLVDDQGEIPAQIDRDTWDRIIALFKARAEG